MAVHEPGWSEARVHAWLAKHLPGTSLNGSARRPIHDAVVLAPGAAPLATACDRTEEGVHFTSEASMQAVAHKAVGRCLSDLAATACQPMGFLLALAAPKGFPEAQLIELLAAAIERGAALGCPLLGGDLTCGPGGLSLVVSALGSAPDDPPGRDRLMPGDVLVSTGPTGGSRLGRHLWIEPRLAEGRALFARGVRGMMDVSDGLALDLSRLARASSVTIELHAVPVHADAEEAARGDARSPFEHALFDGEDHELIAGVPPAVVQELPGLWPLGRVTAPGPGGPGLRIADSLERARVGVLPTEGGPTSAYDPSDPRGYIHGS